MGDDRGAQHATRRSLAALMVAVVELTAAPADARSPRRSDRHETRRRWDQWRSRHPRDRRR